MKNPVPRTTATTHAPFPSQAEVDADWEEGINHLRDKATKAMEIQPRMTRDGSWVCTRNLSAL